ncbi:hypothetical protein FOA52_003637 [Chlamydomonas sp. UWO 241]|nr:hypothetical protein FOA52_003637 [Chlamydomonas sp. UWO 241]
MFLVTLKQLLDDAQTEPKHLTETKARKLDVPPHVADHRAEPPAPENGLLGDVRKVKTWSYKDVHTQAHAARLTLECLRELSALCLPPRAMLDTKLADVVLAFTGHPHPVVASAAQALVARWQRRLLSAANVLTDPTFCEDPTVTVEAGVKQIQRLEEVAAAADAAAAAAAAAADAVDAATGAAAVPASAGVGAAPAAAAAAAAAGEEGGAGEAEGDAGAGAEGDDAMAVD